MIDTCKVVINPDAPCSLMCKSEMLNFLCLISTNDNEFMSLYEVKQVQILKKKEKEK
jgi:hypothetical protein